ncbi:heme oxygenase-like protein [Trichoderma reesei RUT C-30]|jgi:heme oxygenase|uniref:Heme oxygenase-like protein n=1 Tax=Hypocrea jecorina (strain ATCC 56765 / BCRC 32924 / NRRL 11460 / Rut C-30) TaxID=1344414 RepID=A0A024SDG8_HYPJR|nr:heme oxygenase-like protein [Trichoderma reesei RUT C-30]
MSPPNADDAPSTTTKSLAVDIVAATRPMHTRINKLVTSRVPLALPPRSSDPGAYISGLLHILPVYMTFEKLWLDIISSPSPVEDAADGTRLDAESGDGPARVNDSKDGNLEVPERVRKILVALYMPQLFRSDRLRGDIKSMTGWSDEVLDRQIQAIKGTGQLSANLSHIKQAVHAKPHVLVAYSYNLFMALFAGGRYIRASFEKAGNEFWQTVPEPIKPTMQPCQPRPAAAAAAAAAASVAPFSPLELTGDDGLGTQHSSHASSSCDEFLQFWHFDSPEDGEDFKRDYKERLLTWEDTLTADEREDILQESIIILESIGHIVGQLDEVYSDEHGEKDNLQMPRRPSFASHFMQAQFVARLRDSFLIARDRGVGNPFRTRSVDTEASGREEQGGEEDDNNQHDAVTGASKSIRFAKTLPTPRRNKGRDAVIEEDGKLRGGLPMHIVDAMAARPIFAWIVGLLILYVVVRVRGIVSA